MKFLSERCILTRWFFCHASDLHIHHVAHKTLPDISNLSLINVQDHHGIWTKKAWDHSSTYEAEKILDTANYLRDGLKWHFLTLPYRFKRMKGWMRVYGQHFRDLISETLCSCCLTRFGFMVPQKDHIWWRSPNSIIQKDW